MLSTTEIIDKRTSTLYT